jgi:predicted deacylase
MLDFYKNFRTHNEIIGRLVNIPRLKIYKLPHKSKEGRDIILFIVGTGKKKILITGGVHSREWMSPNVTSYVIENILQSNLLSEFTFYFVPIVNPDGYIHSFKEGNRLWRKNMNGVDLNRNFPKGFGLHSSNNPNDDDYRGPHPFSEPETKAMRDLVSKNNFYIHLDIHSYGQMIAGSWAYTDEKHPKHTQITNLGKRMVASMQTKYTFGHGSMNGKLGLSGGTFQDYTASLGTYSFTVELPDQTSFDPSPEIIIPSGKDIIRLLESISQTSSQTTCHSNISNYIIILFFIFLLIWIITKIFNLKTKRNLF